MQLLQVSLTQVNTEAEGTSKSKILFSSEKD